MAKVYVLATFFLIKCFQTVASTQVVLELLEIILVCVATPLSIV